MQKKNCRIFFYALAYATCMQQTCCKKKEFAATYKTPLFLYVLPRTFTNELHYNSPMSCITNNLSVMQQRCCISAACLLNLQQQVKTSQQILYLLNVTHATTGICPGLSFSVAAVSNFKACFSIGKLAAFSSKIGKRPVIEGLI